MKLEDICEDIDLDLGFEEYDRLMENVAALQADFDYSRDLDRSYEEVRILHKAIKKKDWGYLINKGGQDLTYNDVQDIRVKLNNMLKTNIFFGTNAANQQDFEASLRRIGHRVESFILTASAGLFAISSIITGPIGVALSLGSYLLGRRQKKIADSIKTASRVLNVAQSFKQFDKIKDGREKNIEQLIKEKDPKAIERAIRADAKKLKGEISSSFVRDFKKMPKYISYIDKNGERQIFPIEKLFSF